jgi:K+-sensing histidine kinase KdpD
MKFVITNEDDQILVSSVEVKCKSCIDNCTKECHSLICPIYDEERKIGVARMKNKKIFLCTTKKASKTTRLFKEKINFLAYSIPSIETLKDEVSLKAKNAEKNKYSKIVHNLKTLNAQSIQSQFKFIPQSLFAENHAVLYDFVKDEIVQRSDEAALTFLRLAKNNAHMKTEFTTHEKLSVESPTLSIQFHKIRSVILNVYHSFNLDFTDKNVKLKISENEVYLAFDYDTVRVAFYHLILNTINYIQPNTNVDVDIYQKDQFIYVDFKMKSLHICETEKHKIFEDSYSGEHAVKSETNGSGLGMGLIRKALMINGAKIEVICGNDQDKVGGNLYSENIFKIEFKAP